MGRLRNVFDVYWAVYLLCNPSSTLYRIEVLWQVFPLFINAKRDILIEESLSIKMDLLRESKRNKIMANFNTEYNNSTSTEAVTQRVIPICFVFPQREICILYSWNLTIHLLSPTMLRMSFVWMKNWEKKQKKKNIVYFKESQFFLCKSHGATIQEFGTRCFFHACSQDFSLYICHIFSSSSIFFSDGHMQKFQNTEKKFLDEFIESK